MGSTTASKIQETPFVLTVRDQQKCFSLFDLPRELRDEVYDHCFYKVIYSFSDAGCVFRISSGNPHDRQKHEKLPQWLLGSKIILFEAIDRFYKQSVCTVWSRTALSSKHPGPRSLLRLDRVETLHLNANLAIHPIDRSAKIRDHQMRITLHPHSAYTTYINSLADFFSSRPACLRTLKVSLHAPYSYSRTTACGPGNLHVAKPDLSVLRRFNTGLGRVEFVILEPQVDTSQYYELMFAELAFTAVQSELRNIGKYLVYRKDKGIFVRDWLSKKLLPDHGTCGGQHEVPRKTGSIWNLGVCSIPGTSKESIQHKGIPTWEDVGGKDTRFHSREESSTGEVKWHSDTYGEISVTVLGGSQAARFHTEDRNC